MPITYIKTNELARARAPEYGGEFAEIVNRDLCGAEDVSASLRWLERGECLVASPLKNHHQLIYLIEGEGEIDLEDQRYPAERGAGVYLTPGEAAQIRATGNSTLKLLHLLAVS
ncbi:MAG: cupin domain-containing protein [Gammaproteobacteria bacterium]